MVVERPGGFTSPLWDLVRLDTALRKVGQLETGLLGVQQVVGHQWQGGINVREAEDWPLRLVEIRRLVVVAAEVVGLLQAVVERKDGPLLDNVELAAELGQALSRRLQQVG